MVRHDGAEQVNEIRSRRGDGKPIGAFLLPSCCLPNLVARHDVPSDGGSDFAIATNVGGYVPRVCCQAKTRDDVQAIRSSCRRRSRGKKVEVVAEEREL